MCYESDTSSEGVESMDLAQHYSTVHASIFSTQNVAYDHTKEQLYSQLLTKFENFLKWMTQKGKPEQRDCIINKA